MKKLLLISYVFPPAGGITVQRALSFAKYLPANGIETHVLTARNPASPTLDPGLMKHIPPEVRIHRAMTLEPSFYVRKKMWGLLSGGVMVDPRRRHSDGRRTLPDCRRVSRAPSSAS